MGMADMGIPPAISDVGGNSSAGISVCSSPPVAALTNLTQSSMSGGTEPPSVRHLELTLPEKADDSCDVA